MDLDTFLKLAVGIPLGMYAILVIIDAYLLHQYISDINAILHLPKQTEQKAAWYWYCIRYVFALKSIRCQIALYKAVRNAERCLAESSEENKGLTGT